MRLELRIYRDDGTLVCAGNAFHQDALSLDLRTTPIVSENGEWVLMQVKVEPTWIPLKERKV